MSQAIRNIAGAVVLSTSLFAQAQTSSTSAAAVTQSPTATGQSTATIQSQQPAAANKWGGLIVNETSASVTQVRELKDKAAVNNLTTAFLYYKLNDTYKLGLGQIFGVVNNRENASGAFKSIHADNNGQSFEMWSTPVTLGITTNQTFLGSDALKYTLRMDLPTGRYYREIKKNYGTLRMDVAPTWHVGTKVDLGISLSPRLALNSSNNSNKAVASDGVARLVAAPSASYNFSDKLSAYYAYTVDLQSTKILNRATAQLDQANAATHEIGMNIAAGPISINPAITSDVDMNDSSASIMTSNGRVFADETNGYYLGLSAAF